jgi:predicted dehydrogenase
MLNVGVVGYGYWGPNIVRNLTEIRETKVSILCDNNPQALKRAKATYPHLKVTRHFKDILNSSDIQAVAIVTPVSSHYVLARQALEHGKHIFVEKPFTVNSKEAQALIHLAHKNKLIIMVDHTFLFTGAVEKIKETIDRNVLGDLYYYDSTRVSLGLFQHDTNVIWDLAPHDFSIMDYVVKNKPVALSAHGIDHVGSGQENIAYITVYFEGKMIGHINVNWLSPVKVRTTLIGGKKKMLLWDDLQADEKIKIYDKGVSIDNKQGMYKLLVDYRSGDMWSPRVEHSEALKRELIYFAQCIQKNKTPINDGQAGLRVVKMLELATKSLKQGGKLMKI